MRRHASSLFLRLTGFMVLLVFVQSVLLSGTLLAEGLLSHTRSNALQSFHQRVMIRKTYLQAELKSRWTNLAPFERQLASCFSPTQAQKPGGESDLQTSKEFFQRAAPPLVAMLRSTLATGAFIVLYSSPSADQTAQTGKAFPALYFRDYDPNMNDRDNRDLYLVLGPADIATDMQIPLDSVWRLQLPPESPTDEKDANRERSFLHAPLRHAGQSADPTLLGYWSRPFRMLPHDIPVITYTMPLKDADGQTRGVVGVEISLAYLAHFLGDTHGTTNDVTDYLLAVRDRVGKAASSNAPLALVISSSPESSPFRPDSQLVLTPFDKANGIYQVANDGRGYLACAERLELYRYNTPFIDEQWYFLGLAHEDALLAFVQNLRRILVVSFIGSLILGVLFGLVGSWRLTRPISRLAEKVREGRSVAELDRIGLVEIDDLSAAIEDAHRSLLESASTLSRIIDLVDVPIGAFEYREQSPHVSATDQLGRILALSDVEANALFRDKAQFMEKLQRLTSRPEPEEEHVYKLMDVPAKWVRLNMRVTPQRTLGVIIDVTQEIHDKLKIRFDRDYDGLTRLLNHTTFSVRVSKLLSEGELKTAALIMLDLDNLKLINDTYGHGWGDIYIKTAAQLLAGFHTDFPDEASPTAPNKNAQSLVGRRSGDEFVVFLYGYKNRNEIKRLMDRFYAVLARHTLTFPDGTHHSVAISAGLAWVENSDILPTVPYDELLKCADFTLYGAKRARKGTYCFSDEPRFAVEKEAEGAPPFDHRD